MSGKVSIYSTLARKRIKRHPPKRDPGYDDPSYREFIHSLPCVACHIDLYRLLIIVAIDIESVRFFSAARFSQKLRTEMHHAINGGFGKRGPDRSGVPLCGHDPQQPTIPDHHREGPESVGKLGKGFWPRIEIDKTELIRALNAAFDEERR